MTQVAELTIHEIVDWAVPDFLARIETLSKKSMKLLGQPVTVIDHGTKEVQYEVNGRKKDRDGNPYIKIMHLMSVEAATPRIAGWDFVASLEHLPKGNIVRQVPSNKLVLPTKYRTVGGFCDHCGHKRSRQKTFVLHSAEAGTFQQVGSSCLQDFLGQEAEAFVQMAVWLSQMEPSNASGGDEDGYSFGHDKNYISLYTYLVHVNACIREYGWVSAKDAEMDRGQRTSVVAMNNMFPPKSIGGEKPKVLPLTDRDRVAATEALAWAKAINPRSDYEHNLVMIADMLRISWNKTGLAASMIPGLLRHKEQEVKRAERRTSMTGSKHVGAKDERLRNVTAKVYGYYARATSFGAKHIFRMLTPEGNALIWEASTEQDLTIGDTVVFDGTVKKFDEYKGVAQTYLTRCKVISITKPTATAEAV